MATARSGLQLEQREGCGVNSSRRLPGHQLAHRSLSVCPRVISRSKKYRSLQEDDFTGFLAVVELHMMAFRYFIHH
jgi:hypothetical protein